MNPFPLLLKSTKISPALDVIAIFPWSYNSIIAELIPIGSVKKPKSNFISTVIGGEYNPYLGPIVPYAFLKIVALLVAIPKTHPVKIRSLIAL